MRDAHGARALLTAPEPIPRRSASIARATRASSARAIRSPWPAALSRA